jgi:hypothetical protein
MKYVQYDYTQAYVQTLSIKLPTVSKKQISQTTAIYLYDVVQGSYRIGLAEYVHCSRQKLKTKSIRHHWPHLACSA